MKWKQQEILLGQGDKESAGGGREAAGTANTRCGMANIRMCGRLRCGKIFSLGPKVAVCTSYVRPPILHGSETRCKKESEMESLRRMEIHGERNMWSTAQR